MKRSGRMNQKQQTRNQTSNYEFTAKRATAAKRSRREKAQKKKERRQPVNTPTGHEQHIKMKWKHERKLQQQIILIDLKEIAKEKEQLIRHQQFKKKTKKQKRSPRESKDNISYLQNLTVMYEQCNAIIQVHKDLWRVPWHMLDVLDNMAFLIHQMSDEEQTMRKHSLGINESLIYLAATTAKLGLFISREQEIEVIEKLVEWISTTSTEVKKPFIYAAAVYNDARPYLKINCLGGHVNAQLTIENYIYPRKIHLLRKYDQVDSRLKYLSMTMKRFARIAEIDDDFPGGISSYGLDILVIHFLQNVYPPVLPRLVSPLPALPKPNDTAKNTMSLGELWIRMIKHILSYFRSAHRIINIQSLNQVPVLSQYRGRKWKQRGDCIFIEDPLQHKVNVAHSINELMKNLIINVLGNHMEWLLECNHSIDNPVALTELFLCAKFHPNAPRPTGKRERKGKKNNWKIEEKENRLTIASNITDKKTIYSSAKVDQALQQHSHHLAIRFAPESLLCAVDRFSYLLTYNTQLSTRAQTRRRRIIVGLEAFFHEYIQPGIKLIDNFAISVYDSRTAMFHNAAMILPEEFTIIRDVFTLQQKMEAMKIMIDKCMNCKKELKPYESMEIARNSLQILFSQKRPTMCIHILSPLEAKNNILFSAYYEIDERYEKLVRLVKRFGQQIKINAPYLKGGISVVVWAVLVVHFLQRVTPPILPCLHDGHANFGPNTITENLADFEVGKNKNCVGELFVHFINHILCEIKHDNYINISTLRKIDIPQHWISRGDCMFVQNPAQIYANFTRYVTSIAKAYLVTALEYYRSKLPALTDIELSGEGDMLELEWLACELFDFDDKLLAQAPANTFAHAATSAKRL